MYVTEMHYFKTCLIKCANLYDQPRQPSHPCRQSLVEAQQT